MSGDDLHTVVVDTSVLINFAILDRLELLGALRRLRFVVPGEVLAEVTNSEQSRRVGYALDIGVLREVATNDPLVLDWFARLRRQMGLGEAACLALAIVRGWLFACDEKRVVQSEARKLLGPDRLLNTPGLCLLAIRASYWTVTEADEAKALLERSHYRMSFGSFAELLS